MLVFSCVSLSEGLCVVGGEQPRFASQLAFPPRLARAVQNLDNITGVELQLVSLFSVEIVQSFDQQHGGGGGFVLGMEETDTQETDTQIQFYAKVLSNSSLFAHFTELLIQYENNKLNTITHEYVHTIIQTDSKHKPITADTHTVLLSTCRGEGVGGQLESGGVGRGENLFVLPFS